MSGEIKIFKLAFTIILLTSLITYTAAASSVTLSLSPQVISAGETFTVDVFVDPDVAIAGMQFDLEFDNTKFHVHEVTEGDLFTQSGMSTYFNPGVIESGSLSNVYGTILGAASISNPSAFARIIMIVDEQATSASTIKLKNVIISNPEGQAVEIEVFNATVEILSIDSNNDIDDWIGDYSDIDQYYQPDYDPDYELADPHLSEKTNSQYMDWNYLETVLSIYWIYY